MELNLDDEEVVAESENNLSITFEKTLQYQGLTTLSEEDLKPYFNAIHLNLSGNQLTDLPQFITTMPYLEKLTLDNNNFKSIPSVLRHCKQLEEIYINNNPLTSIGLNLWKMKQLEVLHLENTDFKKLPIFPDRSDLIVILPNRNYSNKSKEKLRDYLAQKYKYTLLELY
ncbi:MAG: leucine-rich repeat domain-containing protein [Saprospiraceae bacterium]